MFRLRCVCKCICICVCILADLLSICVYVRASVCASACVRVYAHIHALENAGTSFCPTVCASNLACDAATQLRYACGFPKDVSMLLVLSHRSLGRKWLQGGSYV